LEKQIRVPVPHARKRRVAVRRRACAATRVVFDSLVVAVAVFAAVHRPRAPPLGMAYASTMRLARMAVLAACFEEEKAHSSTTYSTFTLAKITRTNARLDLNDTYPSISASAYATMAE